MRYSEEQWKNIPERDSGLDWWNEPREVIVAWGDPSETPSEAIARLNSEAIEYQRKYQEALEELEKYKEATNRARNALEALTNA